MAFAIDTYTGDGSTVNYSVTFPYIEEAHVVVTLDGITKTLNTDYSFTTSSTITFTTAPSASAVIKFTRSTSQTSRLVDYQDGSTLTEATLDQDGNQSFYMAQEAIDITENTISLSTSTDQWDADNKRITNLASPVDDSDAVTKGFISTNLPNINTVAGISSDVTDVANNNTDISTVAGEISPTNNISTVAGLNTEITSLGAISADITTVANNETDIQTLADLEDGTTATNGLSTLAGIDTEITGVYNIRNNVTNVDGNSADISTVAGQISPTNNIQTVAGLNSEITTLSGLSSEITNLDGISADITTVAGQIAPTNNISTLAGLNTELSALYNIRTDITAVANISTDIQDVQDKITELQTVANDLNEVTSEIETVAGSINNVDAVGADILGSNNIQTVANNISGINSFAERYRVQAGVPSSSNDVGDLVFDTNAQKLKVFDGNSYQLAGSSVNGTSERFIYTATANQTTFSGADDNGDTLTYDVAGGTLFADIYLNGVKLAPADFTATDGTSIILGSGASVNDILQVVSYGTFTLSSQSASNITSGTLDNDRLPSPTLIVKGDGSSADGQIQLNCSQNSHGVKIKSPAHSAGQSYTLILPTSVGTNGQVLATNGNSTNQLTWVDAQETKPTVADVSQTIAPSTATTITITGTNFVSIPHVEFVKTDGSVTIANTVSFTSSTSLSVNVTLASGNYYVRIENPDGNAGRSTNNILTASTAPSFTTSAGSLGTIAGNFSGTVATIAGTSDSAITFSETTSVLTTANVTLNTSTGALTTTDFGGSSTTPTTYNFTIRITDAEGQTADRNFSLTSSFGATGGGQFN